MTAFALDRNVKKIRRGHAGAGTHGHTSGGYFGAQVQSVDFIHLGIVQHPSLDHRLGSGENFLGGLKDQDYRARKRGAPPEFQPR